MSELSRVPPRVALVVSTRGTDSVTVTVCCCSPGWRVTSTRTSLPTPTSTFWRSSFLKPFDSARTVKAPGVRLGALYSPASSVGSVRVTPLAVSSTVTVAPATTPPLWSVTVPIMRPKLPCENAGRQSKSTPKLTVSNWMALLHHPLEDTFPFELKEFISRPLTLKGLNSNSGPTSTPTKISRVKHWKNFRESPRFPQHE